MKDSTKSRGFEIANDGLVEIVKERLREASAILIHLFPPGIRPPEEQESVRDSSNDG
jgi:hypothetical protein